jgi:hypothetical protein
MSTWVIVSWVSVAILTGVNIFVFLKLKGASEQMLKMAFPGAKDMNEALSQMQKMMQGMGGMGGKGGFNPAALAGMMGGAPGKSGVSDAQLKAAMDTLKKMQQQGGSKR